ncbi:glutathione S-transferase 1-like [Gigantopelta aegis]|uniref:glutathione S-transferase 1-like n=1 Tax=Gigantopelta aegis TaxID=1735272 RepID=UPI001B888F81|nr:glutathione S-transferase 1-like [Gigantopelta aegis]
MSPKLELYFFPFSPPARAAWMTCSAAGVPVDIKYIDLLNGEQKTAEFIKINPQHTVPTLVDGDFVLWESRAIACYIVDKYGTAKQFLYPKDLHKRAEVNRLLQYDAGNVWIGVVENWVYKIHHKPPPTTERETAFHTCLDYLDGLLKGKLYLMGSELTIADISICASLSIWESIDEDISRWKNLLKWYQRIKDQPFWEECNHGIQDLKEYYQRTNEHKKSLV